MRRTLLLTLVIAVALFGTPLPGSSQSKTKKQGKSVKELRTNLKSVQAKKSSLATQIRKVKRSAAAVTADIRATDVQLTQVEDSLDRTESRLRAGKQEQAQIGVELKLVESDLADKRKAAAARIRAMFMQGEESGVLALLASRDLGELAARRTVMELVAAADRKLFDALVHVRDKVEERRKRQEALVADLKGLYGQQAASRASIASKKATKRALLEEIQGTQEELEAAYNKLDRESDAIAAQIRAYQRATGGTPFTGRFRRPSSGPITSGYGSRFHPILKKRRMHTGIDFGAPSGSPIWAAASGVVISAGYRGGYGNAVIIDHGGGISTLYGHCSRVFVSAGQRVSSGQKIAAVGSTGLSTGPHLHFEVRVNGSPVNPMGRL